MKRLYVMPPLLLLCSCATDLDVTPIRSGPVVGMAYTLPFTQYAITTKWTVTSCTPALEVTEKIDASVGSAEDGLHAYTIDPRSLQTAVSVAALKVTYQDKTNVIDTINVSAEDQSAAVIGNVVTGAAKLALAVLPAAGPQMIGGPPATPAPPLCWGPIATQLGKVKVLTANLKVMNARLDQATADMKTVAAKASAMGEAVDGATKVALSKAIDNVNRLTAQQTDLVNELADAQKPLTYSLTTYWPTNSQTFVANPGVVLPPSVVTAWTGQEKFAEIDGTAIEFAIERAGSFGRDPGNPGGVADPPDAIKGIRYWIPSEGRLLVCNAEPCNSTNLNAVLLKLDGRISQLGYIGVLPVHTPRFGSTTFAASFDSAGGLKSAGYEAKAAPAVVASGAFSNAAAQLSPVVSALTPTAQLNRETAALEAAKKQHDALAALQADPNKDKRDAADALDADTALLQAEISNRQAKAALDALAVSQAH